MVNGPDGKDARTLNSSRFVFHRLAVRATGWLYVATWRGSCFCVLLALSGLLAIAPDVLAGIQLPVADPSAPILVQGEDGQRWHEGSAEVWVVRRCVLQQDDMTARADRAVLWIIRAAPETSPTSSIVAYLEGAVAIDFGRGGDPNPKTGQAAQSIRDNTWFGRMVTHGHVDMRVSLGDARSSGKPDIFQRAQEAWDQESGPVQPAQLTINAEPIGPPPLTPVAGLHKRVQVGPRSNTLIHIKSFAGTRPNQSVTVFSNGIRAVIQGLSSPQTGNIGRIVIETDRLVLWGPNLRTLSPSGSETEGGAGVPIELYMEGNIVFRQGDRLIYADRMYYNATNEYGVVLSAEMVTPIPDYDGMLRLKADVLQQLNRQFFKAYGAAVTSSQMGVPKYWIQAQSVEFQDTQYPRVDPITGQLAFEQRTGEAAVDHDLLATSRNNFIYVSGLPVFYWPVLATNLRQPTYYIERVGMKDDSILGTQAMIDWNAFQVLGIRKPPAWTKWTFSTDWLSKRGFALGTTVQYGRSDCLTFPGPVRGYFDAWGLYDDGLDDLGGIRKSLVPETRRRGRLLWWHRHDLPDGYQVTAEVGAISDRNFLEEFFEKEWDQYKDQQTRLELKHTHEEQALRLVGSARLNDFFTQTEWLPRLDHFMMGRSLLNDRLTWFAHSQVGYAKMRKGTKPEDPVDALGWAPLPWEDDVEGLRAASRQEIDLPLQAGPVKLVPYFLGEVSYWREVLNDQKEVTRAYGQAGVRASLPIWKANPTVHNMLLNLNGMAHKITLESDFYWADASEDLGLFPLYDPVDDDSQEDFRRRMFPRPPEYDERNFLFRSNVQGWVTAPTTEVVEDVMAVRTGIHQRWQTKRGMPGQQRVVDWISFDVDATIFPNRDRDNFGEYLGLAEYDFKWHVGDRLTLLSSGYADPFAGGFRKLSVGGAISRPGRGRLYVGGMVMDGPFRSDLLLSTLSYRLSEKWIAEGSIVYDFSTTGQIGERLSVTRIGESALIRVGIYVDHGRDNVGGIFIIEPRFLPHRQLGRVAGVEIPPAGALGLE